MSNRRAAAAPPQLPGYTFISGLGSGGFSEVYLYEQERPRRKVAVKVLTADLKTAGARTRFESEANLMAELSAHPYIVTIYEAQITDSGHSYLAMEYCSRPSLDIQFKQGRFSADKAMEIGIQVASAVETAHRAGIAHRDIKPANILVTDYNRPALTDFGISGTTDPQQDDGGGMSVPWSPPESFGSGATDGVKVDIWALGATIYTLLAGHSPFVIPGAENSYRIIGDRIASMPLPKLGRADIPEALEMVLATAMAKHPSSRYSSAKDFARALMRVQADLNYSVTPFEVQEDVVVHDGRPSNSDDYSEATRVRSIVSIDPDASTSNPTFPSRNTSGGQHSTGPGTPAGGNSFTAPPHINTVPGVTGSSTGLTRNGQTVPSQDTTGGPTVRKSYSNIASATSWNDTAVRSPAQSQNQNQSQSQGQNQAAQSQLAQRHILEQTVGRSEVLAPAADAHVPTLEPAKKKGKWLGLISGLLLVAGVVIGIIVFLNVGAPEQASPSTDPSTPPPTALVVGTEVPQVTDLTAKPINGGAEWTWTNPEPLEGDQYMWAAVSVVDAGEFKRITDNKVFVVNDANGSSCIAVKLLRKNGQVSEEIRKCFSSDY
ncbi:serine/threonine-protein kinase [Specibacter sp. NPDC078709]|uniref:serine/threonine-protein kinase n=1 Tax=Specibacter sp. NPDC078709 TaxID=3154364 RepID=UPI003438CA9C